MILSDRMTRVFAEAANAGGCFVWPHSRQSKGYGQIWRDGKNALAHRVAYEIAYGPIPDGLWVLHHCDNPPCINLRHLYLGTPSDNSRDMVAKGRRKGGFARGSACRRGHAYDADNTRHRADGRRDCRACDRIRDRLRRAA